MNTTTVGTREEIFEDLKKIINDTFKINTENLDIATKLFNGGLSLNSIQLIELTVAIENFYDKQLATELLTEENFQDIITLAEVIKNNF